MFYRKDNRIDIHGFGPKDVFIVQILLKVNVVRVYAIEFVLCSIEGQFSNVNEEFIEIFRLL